TVEELLALGLMPTFDGLNVFRGTVVDLQPVPDSPGEFVSPSWKVAVKLAPKGDKLQVQLKNQLKRPQEGNLQLLVQVEPGGEFFQVPPIAAKQPVAEAGGKTKGGSPRGERVPGLDAQAVDGREVLGLRQQHCP